MEGYFSFEKVTDHVKRIMVPGDVYVYLVEGERAAALIDTGCGVGDLRAYVEGLTDKPVTVLLTHGHLDHAPGAAAFGRVYMSKDDLDIYKAHNDLKKRIGYLDGTSAKGHYLAEDLIPVSGADNFMPLYDGFEMDLGAYHIAGYSSAGHTPGSFVFLLKEERMLLLGDACNTFTFLFDKSSLGLSSYEKNLMSLKQKVKGSYDNVLLSHGEGVPSRDMIDEVIRVCEEIKAGITDDVPFVFGDRSGSKAYADERKNEYGEIMGNIVYDRDRISE